MRIVSIILVSTAVQLLAALNFVQPPTMSMNTGSSYWTITFEVSENTDVEVSVVNLRDSSVVRHLAAGLLGSNPPAPLTANTLAQSLSWDGKDDFGKPAAHPESLTVRVRAGMTPVLDNLAGEDLYSFQGNGRSTPSMLLDKDGTVLLFGKAASNSFLRKYDGAGNYVRTIYPPSASLPADSVTAYGINAIPEGGWVPKTSNATGPTITSSIMNSAETRMLTLTDKGEIILVNGRTMQTIGKNGSFTNSATQEIITSPAAPVGRSGPWGPQYFAASHNPDYLYFSGIFYGSVDMGTWLISADTNGFWADGQVFKVNRNSGVVTSWIKLDSVPSLGADRTTKIGWGTNAIATIHGVTIDDSNHVFVCDRLHKRISVYDTNAVLQGSIPCNNPDFVALSKRTGAVYVLTRGPSLLRLVKFDNWRTSTTPTATQTITTSVDGYKGAPVMTVTENGNATSVYIGYGATGFRLYADNGTSFSLMRDFSESQNSSLIFERVAVNRATDQVYWMVPSYGNPGKKIWSIADWSRSVPYPVYTPAKSGLNIDNITIGPKGHIYGLGFEDFDTPITRYTGDSIVSAAPYANTGKNIASCDIHYEGMNHRGVAVGWQGQTCAYEEGYYLREFADTGCTDTSFKGKALITMNSTSLGHRVLLSGVKYDAAGNFYIGAMVKAPDAIIPPGFGSDNMFNVRCGSVIKFTAGTTGTVNVGPTAVIGAEKTYPQPFGPFSGDNSSLCNCRNSYFDVDPYGRLYVPNATAAQVSVADNSGNTIVALGQYGNSDSRGPLAGPGETVAEPAIPMAWPTSVAASEDYIYVADQINARLVRIKMNFALDNVPGLTDRHSGVADVGARCDVPVKISATPNPFNPVNRISVMLPGKSTIRLDVYDINGRLVKNIASGEFKSGVNTFVWDATNAAGAKVSAGIYVYKLTSSRETLVKRVVLAK